MQFLVKVNSMFIPKNLNKQSKIVFVVELYMNAQNSFNLDQREEKDAT